MSNKKNKNPYFCSCCNVKQTNTGHIVRLIGASQWANTHQEISTTEHVLVSRKLSTLRFYYSEQVAKCLCWWSFWPWVNIVPPGLCFVSGTLSWPHITCLINNKKTNKTQQSMLFISAVFYLFFYYYNKYQYKKRCVHFVVSL